MIVGTHLLMGVVHRDAFIWDPEIGMRSLGAYLESLGVDLGGWDLWSATGISADGKTIVGYGENPLHQEEAFIAVIPEPATAVLVGFGLAGLAVTGRRRKV